MAPATSGSAGSHATRRARSCSTRPDMRQVNCSRSYSRCSLSGASGRTSRRFQCRRRRPQRERAEVGPAWSNCNARPRVLSRSAAHRTDDPNGDVWIIRRCDAALLLCHGCASRVDGLAMTAGDRRVVRSAQPAAADRQPPARDAGLPQRTTSRSECSTVAGACSASRSSDVGGRRGATGLNREEPRRRQDCFRRREATTLGLADYDA